MATCPGSSQVGPFTSKSREARCRNQAVSPLPSYRERCSARAGRHRRRSCRRSMTRYGATGRAIRLIGSPTWRWSRSSRNEATTGLPGAAGSRSSSQRR